MDKIDELASERWRNSEGERQESGLSRSSMLSTGHFNDSLVEARAEDIYSDDMDPAPSPAQSGSGSASPISSDYVHSDVDAMALDRFEQNELENEQMDDNSELDEDNSSPLDFARQHGLVCCHMTENPFRAVELLSPETAFADLEDPDSVSTLDDLLDRDAFLKLNEPERLDVGRETATYLASALSPERDDEPLEALHHTNEPSYLRDLKIEVPVLTSDPDLDLWRLRRRNAAIISSKGMKPFELNDDIGKGLAWSIEEKRAHSETEKLIAGEKLDMDIETLTYLKDEILVFCKATTNDDIIGACLSDCQTRLTRPESPPLLPISPPLSPLQPSTAVMNIPLTSSPADLTAQEAMDMEQQILEQDEAPSTDPNAQQARSFDTNLHPKCLYSPLCTPQNTSSSPLQRTRIRDLEIDVPLIPEDSIEVSARKPKNVTFHTELLTMIPTSDADLRTSDHERDLNSFVEAVITPLAEPVIEEAKNERLSELDTTMRIRVPDIGQIELKAPWPHSEIRPNALKKSLSETKASLADSDKKWSGVSKVERLLSWSPFPTRLGKVQTDETFDDGSLARYMAEITFEDRIDAEGLVWKPEGMRILDDAESDNEELECLEEEGQDEGNDNHKDLKSPGEASVHIQQTSNIASVPDRSNDDKSGQRAMDMQTLLKKRKLELEAGKDSVWPNKQPDRNATTDAKLPIADEETSAMGIAGGMSAFMGLHGQKLKAESAGSKPRGPTLQQFAPPAVMVQPKTNSLPGNVPAPLPTPEILSPEARKAVIMSSDLAKNRALMRIILRALPHLEVIEREALVTHSPNVQSATKGANRYEADITLSAGTGVVVTTLQQLRQKPLPGQSNFFSVRDRIQSVAVRYEQIHILVNEATLHMDDDLSMTSALDQQDAEALSGLIGFINILDTDVEVCYVAGGQAELAQWLAALISRHAISAISLLHDETLWERFLRYAGLNSYASQAILGQLKRVEGQQTDMSSSSVESLALLPYGLAAFVQMTAEERVERFGPMMGGDRVLRRVNDVINSHWMSAASKKR